MKDKTKTEQGPVPVLSGREGAVATVIGALLALLYAAGAPGALLKDLYIGNVGSAYITRYGNFLLTAFLGIVLTRLCLPRYRAGFRAAGFAVGWKRCGSPASYAFLLAYIGLVLGLRPFDVLPSLSAVLFDGVLAYLCAALVEESIYRGLLLRGLEALLPGRRAFSVLVAALLFTVGQFTGGMAELPLPAFLCHFVWALGLGIFLGAAYLQTGNLWFCALASFLNRIGALAFFFSSRDALPALSAAVIAVVYALLGAWGVYLSMKQLSIDEKENI